MTGHMTCAAGALNLLAGVYGDARRRRLPHDQPRRRRTPSCDLDYVPNEARELDVDAVLVNAFAFGGTNGCARASKKVA